MTVESSSPWNFILRTLVRDDSGDSDDSGKYGDSGDDDDQKYKKLWQ